MKPFQFFRARLAQADKIARIRLDGHPHQLDCLVTDWCLANSFHRLIRASNNSLTARPIIELGQLAAPKSS